jgi:hypothetical protein
MKAFTSFSNAKTEEQFEAVTKHDQKIMVPVNKKTDCASCVSYNGWLSDITPCAAERYVKSGGNLIKAKTTSVQNIVAPNVENTSNESEH